MLLLFALALLDGIFSFSFSGCRRRVTSFRHIAIRQLSITWIVYCRHSTLGSHLSLSAPHEHNTPHLISMQSKLTSISLHCRNWLRYGYLPTAQQTYRSPLRHSTAHYYCITLRCITLVIRTTCTASRQTLQSAGNTEKCHCSTKAKAT